MIFGSTRGAVFHLKRRAKQVAFAIALIMQLVYIGYLIYLMVKGGGILGVNIGMCAISVLYLAFFLTMEIRYLGMSSNHRKEERRVAKKIKKYYKWIKLAVKSVNLGIIIYSLYVDSVISTAFSTIVTTLMIILWIIEFTVALGSVVIDYIVDVVLQAIEEDKSMVKETVTAPVKKVKRAFGKVGKFFGFGSGDEEEEKFVRDPKFVRWEEELAEYKERERQIEEEEKQKVKSGK